MTALSPTGGETRRRERECWMHLSTSSSYSCSLLCLLHPPPPQLRSDPRAIPLQAASPFGALCPLHMCPQSGRPSALQARVETPKRGHLHGPSHTQPSSAFPAEPGNSVPSPFTPYSPGPSVLVLPQPCFGPLEGRRGYRSPQLPLQPGTWDGSRCSMTLTLQRDQSILSRES